MIFLVTSNSLKKKVFSLLLTQSRKENFVIFCSDTLKIIAQDSSKG